MLKRVTAICALALIFGANGFAQDIPATDCDRYAASDEDPLRKTVDVPTAEINPALAIPACEVAVRQYPNSGRLIHQLGRSYYKANNFDAAIAQFRKAAGQGYAPAQNSLGVMYEKGQGVPKDWEQAFACYQKAADQGYSAAQNNLRALNIKSMAQGGIILNSRDCPNPSNDKTAEQPTSQPPVAALNAQDQTRIFHGLVDFQQQLASVSNDPTLTSFQMDAKLQQLRQRFGELTVRSNTPVEDWVCTVTDVVSEKFGVKIRTPVGTSGLGSRRLVGCYYGNPTNCNESGCLTIQLWVNGNPTNVLCNAPQCRMIQLWVNDTDERLMAIQRGNVVHFDGRVVCLNQQLYECGGFPKDVDVQNLRTASTTKR
jgi:Sel1 repeat